MPHCGRGWLCEYCRPCSCGCESCRKMPTGAMTDERGYRNMPYAIVKELPESLQSALSAVGYGRKDIELRAKETESLFCAGGDGYRGFAVLVNIATGEREVHRGSWGGSNAFNPNNSVDLNDKEYELPLNGAVIKGSEGGSRPVFATITLHPGNMAKFLPAKAELSEAEQHVLWCFKALKSGPYRQSALGTKSGEAIEALVGRKFLKRSTNGATQITTEGRNALEASGYKGSY